LKKIHRLNACATMGQMGSRLLAWWYFSIAVGFVLLAIHRVLNGGNLWLIVLRLVIAMGFTALGSMQLRSHRR
jgi:hypothetical protein